MSSKTAESPADTVDGDGIESFEIAITARVVLGAMAGGLFGTAAMAPILVGVPELLGLFRTGPVTQFAELATFFGLDPTIYLGVALFVFGGAIVLPLTFLVVGAFLPPESPRYLRGATFATAFWFGFVPAFWPDAGLLTSAAFLVFSLLGHWIYGLSLGYVLSRVVGIPQHSV
ncbi:cytochrome C oxidase subunit I [Halobellus sp. Atlit-31R]|nr:cytochrome C oxidase subunit I [Halobellus sp. Atlit-31R]